MSNARRGTRQFADDAGAGSDHPINSRTMDLKGAGSVEALGKLMKVEYDEGGPSPVPYIGLVVYTESSRCLSRPMPPISPHCLSLLWMHRLTVAHGLFSSFPPFDMRPVAPTVQALRCIRWLRRGRGRVGR